ncbi:MAG TPA: IPTL-CTERM sorting domain-containing protein [Casimicrobiaceae bacterium]|nr:IPTL-CTERM sorting domain-containing protein [Casimicrobiaceae bacterium]
MRQRFVGQLACAFVLCLQVGLASSAVFNVTTTTDGGPGSLRQAVIDANTAAGPDTINVPAGTYVLGIPGAGEDAAATGDLDITDSVTINGAGSGVTTISAGGGFADRIFHVTSAGATVSINGVTITGGSPGGSASGGGILNAGVLTLSDVVVAQNAAGIQGGGIASTGTLTLTNSVVRNNTALQGGGVHTAAFTATDCTIRNNTTSNASAGGLFVLGPFTISRCTISNNTAGGGNQGGGMFVLLASGTLTNVTIANNTAGSGGGIFNNPPATPPENVIRLVNSTVAFNISGGLRSFGTRNFSILNTLLASNSGSDCPNTDIVSEGFNLITNTSTCTISGVTTGNILNVGAGIGSLANNGGPTETIGLNAGSPAIDAATAAGAPPTDQRGVPRPVGTAFDIGAFEGTLGGGGGPLPALSINNVTAGEGNAGATNFTFTVTLSAASAQTVTVNFATSDGTANAASDYNPTSGQLTFAPGQTSQPIVVTVVGDTAPEPNETFFVNLSNAVNATIAATQGAGTITNDDASAPPPPPPPADIPTLSEWALACLTILLAGMTALTLRRRRYR